MEYNGDTSSKGEGTLEQIKDPLASLAEVEEEADDDKFKKVSKVLSELNGIVPQKRTKGIKRLMELLLETDLTLLSVLISSVQATELDRVSSALVTVFDCADSSEQLISKLINYEVNQTGFSIFAKNLIFQVDPATLFRGNNMVTKAVSIYVRRAGEVYLFKTLKSTLEEICSQSASFEIDPLKLKPGDDLNQNIKHLNNGVENFINAICSSASACPSEMKTLCYQLRNIVSSKFPDFARVAIAGLIFLRFFNPAIVAPDKIIPKVDVDKRRNLVLVSKVLQNIANKSVFAEKEAFMKVTNDSITKYTPKVEQFLDDISVNHPSANLSPSLVNKEELISALNTLYKHIYTDQERIKSVLTTYKKTQVSAQTALEELDFILEELGAPPLIESVVRPQRSATVSQPMTPQDVIYFEYLNKAAQLDFSDMQQLKAIYTSGNDQLGRPIVVFILERIPVKKIDMEKLFLYIIKIMDPIVSKDYVVVFFHSPLESAHRPTFAWLRTVWGVFNRKYKKNLKELHVVKPTQWLKFLAACFRPFVSSKFWKKLYYVEHTKDLRAHFGDRLQIPQEFVDRL